MLRIHLHEGLAEPSKDDVLAKVEDIFQSNNMHYEYFWSPSRGCVVVDIDGGDWKHDHLALEHLMDRNGFLLQDTEKYGGSSDGDWYSARYYFKPMSELDEETLRDMVGKDYVSVVDTLTDYGYDASWIKGRVKDKPEFEEDPVTIYTVFRGRSEAMDVYINRLTGKVTDVKLDKKA